MFSHELMSSNLTKLTTAQNYSKARCNPKGVEFDVGTIILQILILIFVN